MLEIVYQSKVIDTAHMFGWRIAHFRTSMNARGDYRTAVGADGKGWPDLVLVHPKRGIYHREIKTDKGQVTPEQYEWGQLIEAAGGDWAIWRPRDWDVVVEFLSHTNHTNTNTRRTT